MRTLARVAGVDVDGDVHGDVDDVSNTDGSVVVRGNFGRVSRHAGTLRRASFRFVRTTGICTFVRRVRDAHDVVRDEHGGGETIDRGAERAGAGTGGERYLGRSQDAGGGGAVRQTRSSRSIDRKRAVGVAVFLVHRARGGPRRVARRPTAHVVRLGIFSPAWGGMHGERSVGSRNR